MTYYRSNSCRCRASKATTKLDDRLGLFAALNPASASGWGLRTKIKKKIFHLFSQIMKPGSRDSFVPSSRRSTAKRKPGTNENLSANSENLDRHQPDDLGTRIHADGFHGDPPSTALDSSAGGWLNDVYPHRRLRGNGDRKHLLFRGTRLLPPACCLPRDRMTPTAQIPKRKEPTQMQASQQTRKISARLSLMILATGFTLMGLVSILHHPVLGDALEVSSIGCAVGGCASMAIGSIFSFAALVYWRQPSYLAVAPRWRYSTFDSLDDDWHRSPEPGARSQQPDSHVQIRAKKW